MPQQQSLTGWQNLHQNIAAASGNPIGGNWGWGTPTTSYDSVSDWRDQTGIGLLDMPGLGSGMIAPGWKPAPPSTPSPGPSQDWEGIAFLLLGLM